MKRNLGVILRSLVVVLASLFFLGATFVWADEDPYFENGMFISSFEKEISTSGSDENTVDSSNEEIDTSSSTSETTSISSSEQASEDTSQYSEESSININETEVLKQKVDTGPIIKVETHIQDVGWVESVSQQNQDFLEVGTTGRNLKIESLRISLDGKSDGVSLTGLIQGGQSWQNGTKSGEYCEVGTTGRNLRLQAINMSLQLPEEYDFFYQLHVQDHGWLGWARNGEDAGFADGLSLPVEAIRFKISKKNNFIPDGKSPIVSLSTPKLTYSSHVENIGWQKFVDSPEVSGTTACNLQIEALRVSLSGGNVPGNIEYKSHVSEVGWQGYVQNGNISGTTGRNLQMEAIQIQLTGNLKDTFDLYYRSHVANKGWTGWARNGEKSGSVGLALQLEAIEIRMMKKIPLHQLIVASHQSMAKFLEQEQKQILSI